MGDEEGSRVTAKLGNMPSSSPHILPYCPTSNFTQTWSEDLGSFPWRENFSSSGERNFSSSGERNLSSRAAWQRIMPSPPAFPYKPVQAQHKAKCIYPGPWTKLDLLPAEKIPSLVLWIKSMVHAVFHTPSITSDASLETVLLFLMFVSNMSH